MNGSPEMIPDDLLTRLSQTGARVKAGAKLADYTTFRLGGACPALIDCSSAESLRAVWSVLAAREVPRLLIGGGSNLLVHDDGVDRLVVRFCEPDATYSQSGNTVTVSAGMELDAFAAATAQAGLDGVVYCSGIPGTVGGAVAGNAGAFGEQIGDRVSTVELMKPDGTVCTVERDELDFAYRRSGLQQTDDVVLSATLEMEPAFADDLLSRRQEILALRAEKHPDWKRVPTAGSFFKNVEPSSRAGRRQAAGWFLQEAGAMAMRAGGARTFEKHANIIIGGEGCRAADVWELSRMMAAAVKEKFDLTLQREVKAIGFSGSGPKD